MDEMDGVVRHQVAYYLAGRRGKDLSCALHSSASASGISPEKKKRIKKGLYLLKCYSRAISVTTPYTLRFEV